MARGKGGGDDWGTFFKILIGVGLGAAALYYIQAGRGEENDAALIPDGLEGRIDLVVKKLNERFSKAWVDAGLDALELYLKAILPWEVVRLVSVIYQVEQLSQTTQLDGHAKQQTALNWIQRGIT